MKWNSKIGYKEYQSTLISLKTLLGLQKIDFIVVPELAPYCTNILKYIENNILETNGMKSKKIDNIKLVLELFNVGSNLIIGHNARELASEVGGLISDSEEEDELKYDQELFIFSWTNILSSLSTRLNILYAPLLEEPLDVECPCDCPKGDDQNTWDHYSSGVWPNDEDTVQIPSEKKDRICTCNYKKP